MFTLLKSIHNAMRNYCLLFTFILILFISPNTFGSGIGVRGGLNFSSLPSTSQIAHGDATIESLSDSYTGFHFGLVGYISLFNFFIQSELLYTQTGQEMVVSHFSTDLDKDFFTNKYSHLSIPVIGGTSFGPLRLGIGPVVSFLLDSKQGLPHLMGEDLVFQNNNATVGFQAMAGIKIGDLMLDLKYEGSLSQLGDGVSIGETPLEFDTRPRQFIISLGILIF